MGRILLFAAAALLMATALIHTGGEAMVAGWVAGMPDFQKQAVRLVWLTDSVAWAAVAVVWAAAGWKGERGWLGASAWLLAIPLATAAAILAIDPGFFGGWMLLGSAGLAATGLATSWKRA